MNFYQSFFPEKKQFSLKQLDYFEQIWWIQFKNKYSCNFKTIAKVSKIYYLACYDSNYYFNQIWWILIFNDIFF